MFLFFKNFFHRAVLSIGLVRYSFRYGKFFARANAAAGRQAESKKGKNKEEKTNKQAP